MVILSSTAPGPQPPANDNNHKTSHEDCANGCVDRASERHWIGFTGLPGGTSSR